ncbi:MAG TPA: chemotaxis protein [Bradyrhizobium sp.]|nr:chemotaxis protein [Bradyrhizobium sp.]
MSLDVLPDTSAAIASIEVVSSRIEDAFAQAGNQLGRGQAMFRELDGGLTALSKDLSGANIEGASAAIEEIAGKLNELAEALPAESALLDNIGSGAKEASALLKPLFKHIETITIIARSARIEAASLNRDRESFEDFTAEALELGRAVQQSIEGCARDQELLSRAVDAALSRHKEFEKLYRAELHAAGAGLISAHAELRTQQRKSVHLAELAGRSTKKIAEAAGSAIVSLQSGDCARQRLEHVCSGLRRAAGLATGGDDAPQAARVVRRLEVLQLRDAEHEFNQDIGRIGGSLKAILADAGGIVAQSRSSQSDGAESSFLEGIKRTLARALDLIATCESSGKSVDEALAVVDDTLGKFRQAIAGLSEAIVDIILIGMNAGLKAGHLGAKGNAFVVIAGELKATADHVSAGAARLKPILDRVETAANGLKELRGRADPAQLARLEPSIGYALREVEGGNERLGSQMARLAREGAEFENLMQSAAAVMTGLGEGLAKLKAVAAELDRGATGGKAQLAARDEAMLEELFAQYTMEREREVHDDCLRSLGLVTKPRAVQPKNAAAEDEVEFF